MSQESNSHTSAAVQLFQDAHQKMVMLKRVDEQMAQLLQRRRGLMDELRQVQSQINHEFQRLFDVPEDLPERLQSLLNEPARNASKVFAEPVEDDAAVA
jgi:hypothetical protein